jgi:hypothetical protein
MVAGANGGGGMRCCLLELMVVTTLVHVGGAPTHISFGLISSESV